MKFLVNSTSRGLAVAIAATILGLSACGSQGDTGTVAADTAAMTVLPAGLVPAASIIDLMNDMIAPASDVLWQNTDPKSDQEWDMLRGRALVLMESANALVMQGRPVAREGQTLNTFLGEHDYDPARSGQAIAANPAAFTAMSAAMQNAAREALVAIDKKDKDAFSSAGDDIYTSCESCHSSFWYPEALAEQSKQEPPQ